MLERFIDIFSGLKTAYGKTTLTGKVRETDGKKLTDNTIIRGEVTTELYQRHLDGKEPALGIVPINENSLCRWGCVDVDDYSVDLQAIIKRIKDLPAILFRSKSGGGHLFIFTKEWVPADILRRKLQILASFIGYAGAERIPKQDKKRSEKSVGSYLNLPYHGGDRSTRYAFGPEGNALTMQEFFEYYDQKAMTLQQLEDFQIEVSKEKVKEKDDFYGMPPCLKTLLSAGVGEGQRNDTMFHLGIYLYKRYPKSWQGEMHIYNKKYFNPPIDASEVLTISGSIEKEKYQYKCKSEPMVSYCDALKCVMEKFGVGEDDTPRALPEAIEKYKSTPAIYTVTIGGEEVECDVDTLWNATQFGKVAFDQVGIVTAYIGQPKWLQVINRIKNSDAYTEVDPPESALLHVQLQESFQEFVSATRGKDIEDVDRSKTVIKENKEGEAELFFKWNIFWKRLIRSKVWPEKTKTKIITHKMFCDLYDAKETVIHIGDDNKSVRVIRMPAIDIKKLAVRKNERKKAPFEA